MIDRCVSDAGINVLTLKKTLRDFDYFQLASTAIFESLADKYAPAHDFRCVLEEMGNTTIIMCFTARDFASPYTHPPNDASYTSLARLPRQDASWSSSKRRNMSPIDLNVTEPGPPSPQSPTWRHRSSLFSPGAEFVLRPGRVPLFGSRHPAVPFLGEDREGQWNCNPPGETQSDMVTSVFTDWISNGVLIEVPPEDEPFENFHRLSDDSSLFHLSLESSGRGSTDSQKTEIAPIHLPKSQIACEAEDAGYDGEQDLLDAFLVEWSDSPPPLGA